MAARREVAVLAVTHLRKSPGSAVHRAIGSIAFAAAARAVWAVAPDPADAERRLFLAVKQNLSAPAAGMAFRVIAASGTARAEWETGQVNLTANDVLGGSEVREGRSEIREAMEWLRDLLGSGSVAQKKIRNSAEAAGLSWATVRRAKDALGATARKSGYHAGWEWRLEHVEPEDAQPRDSQMSTFEQAIERSNVNGNRGVEAAHRASVSTFPPFEPKEEYLPDSEGPGCTCLRCDGHFGTLAGWRAHILRGRCAK